MRKTAPSLGLAMPVIACALLPGTRALAQDAPGIRVVSLGSPILWMFGWISAITSENQPDGTVGAPSHRSFLSTTTTERAFTSGIGQAAPL